MCPISCSLNNTICHTQSIFCPHKRKHKHAQRFLFLFSKFVFTALVTHSATVTTVYTNHFRHLSAVSAHYPTAGQPLHMHNSSPHNSRASILGRESGKVTFLSANESRPDLRLAWPHQWTLGALFPEVKWPKREANHLSLCSSRLNSFIARCLCTGPSLPIRVSIRSKLRNFINWNSAL
jgi:hypothetical protein